MEMLKFAKNSICVANAHNDAKEVSNLEVDYAVNDGVPHYILNNIKGEK